MNRPLQVALAGAASDDLSIAHRIARGERSAFELVMRRYNRRLYRLARAVLRDDADAKDALQDAYLCAYRSMGQFRGEAALSTWLSRLVLNECSARSRRSLRRESIVSIVSTDPGMEAFMKVADSGESPDRHAERLQIRRVLESRISELPETLRLVFVLRSVEELSVEETAETLSISAEAVRTRHLRAKSLLREALAKEIDLAQGDVFEFGGECCDRTVAAVLAHIGPAAGEK